METSALAYRYLQLTSTICYLVSVSLPSSSVGPFTTLSVSTDVSPPPSINSTTLFPLTNVLFPLRFIPLLSSSYYASRYRHTSTRTSRPLQKTSHQHDSDWNRFSRYQHSVSFTNYPSSTISSPPAEQLPSGHKTRRSAPFP